MAFSPDGKLLASGGFDTTVRVWDVANRREIFTRELGVEGTIFAVAFSSDGKTLASAGTHGRIHLWRPSEQKLIGTLNIQDSCKALAFSLDGHFLAAGDGARIRVWDLGTHEEITTLEGCQGIVNSVAFSGDGKTFVASSADGAVRVWNVSGFECIDSIAYRI